jgi:AAA15 family ATPase/GTPase
MAIARISIKNFRQFSNLNLELTYPSGHPKAGSPLEKVCIIGQSSTGKTTLLQLIKDHARRNIGDSGNYPSINYDLAIDSTIQFDHIVGNIKFSSLQNHSNHNPFTDQSINWKNFQWKDNEIQKDKLDEFLFAETNLDHNERTNNQWDSNFDCIYFPVGFRFTNNFSRINDTHRLYYKTLDFSAVNIQVEIQEIQDVLREYLNQFMSELYKVSQAPPELLTMAQEEFQKWKKEYPNFLDYFAENLNPILELFNLRIDNEINPNSLENYNVIPVKPLHGNTDIRFNLLSSGAQQILLISLLLTIKEPYNCTILIDEIENSLYPDIQQKIISLYQKIAPKNQFIIATHSHLVASSFEPWEIIELKFDYENGTVYQDQNLIDPNVGRHVNNYKYNPSLLNWQDTLQLLFDIEEDRPAKGFEELQRLIELKQKIESLQHNSKEEDELAKLKVEFLDLAKQLNWPAVI